MSPNLKILVADDDPDHVRLITEILNQELKAEVESVAKGEECLKKVIKNRYDLLLLDYLFPDISGLDILKEIVEKGNDLPIIMISGHGTEKVAVDAMKAGAIDYIVKSEDGFQSLPFAAKRAIEKDQLRKKLRQSEEKFKNLFESASDAIIYLDEAGRILEANKQVVEMFGVSKPEVLGKQLIRLDIFPPGEIPAFLNSYADILAGREVTQDVCIKNKKGQEITLECSTSLTKTDDKVTGVMFIARDITERKRAEEALQESEEKYRNLVERANDGIVIVQDGIIKLINARLAEMRGVTVEEVIGTPFTDQIYPDELPEVVDRYKQRMAGEDVPPIYETALRRRDGSKIHAELNAGMVTYQGKPADLVIIRDITERKRAEEALKKSEEYFRALTENSSDIIIILDKKGTITYTSPSIERFSGYKPEELIGKSGFDFIKPVDLPKAIYDFSKAILTKENVIPNTFRVRHKDGSERILSGLGKNLLDNPAVAGFVMNTRDITERNRAEEALRESEEKYRNLVESISDVIYAIDSSGVLTYMSPVVKKILGYEPDEVVGRQFLEFVHKEDHALLMRRFSELREENVRYSDYRMIDKYGDIKWVRTMTKPIIEEGDFVGGRGTLIDITERKRAEEALRESEERYRTVARLSSEFAYSCLQAGDDGYEVNWITDAFFTLTGYSDAELHEQRCWFFVSHPDDREMATKPLHELKVGESDTREFRVVTKGGRVLYIINHMECQVDPTAPGGLRLFGAVQDITERKKAEEEIQRKAKELQEKNDELTRFTYAVSHDLRSPLVTVQTFQGHLERDIRSRDAARVEKDLGYIRNAADKMGRLLDDLRRFSRVGRIINPSEEAPLQAIVKEALDLVAGRITGRGVRIDLTEEPVVLYGDRTRLVEVFLNLVDNAVKFMGDQPAPRVEIGVEEAGEELALHVRDNGIGIDPELQPLVFGLFHKLDPGSEGEGIGLALAKRIVELHGGRIWVESESLGKGTTFRFTLANMRRGVGREERT